jgi:hypothetical protein
MVKLTMPRVQHIPDIKVYAVTANIRRHTFSGNIDKLARDIDCRNLRSAPGQFVGDHAWPTAGIQNPFTVQIIGQPVEQRTTHLFAALPDGRPNPTYRGIRGQPPPRLDGSIIEVCLDLTATFLV